MDKITITNLKVFAHHGVFPEERHKGQFFYVNAVLYLETRKAGESDCLSDSVDYGKVCHFITDFLQEHTYQLLEAAAEHLAEQLLLQESRLDRVEIELCKPYAPIGLPFENVSVTIERGWHTAYLAVGSNMGDREGYIKEGIARLSNCPQIRVEKVSDLVRTAPYGGVEQEDFLNGALKIKTLFLPGELLGILHETEQMAGRKRTVRWGPRTLDLDIIFYDRMILDEEDLKIPHEDMQNRLFVLEPLAQLCPHYSHPILKKTVQELAKRLKNQETHEFDEKKKHLYESTL